MLNSNNNKKDRFTLSLYKFADHILRSLGGGMF